jgi:uncharacterized protein (TIGR02271 family)
MALAKIADLYPNYKEDIFGGEDIKSFSVYDYTRDKIGSVHDVIVDETGRFRYIVVDTGFWIFGKKVLLPVGQASIDYSDKKVYVNGLTKDQAENLPEYNDDMTVDYDYEERVRKVYRGTEYEPGTTNTVYPQQAGAYGSGAYAGTDTDYDRTGGTYTDTDRDRSTSGAYTGTDRDLSTSGTSGAYTGADYTYDRDPQLYQLDQSNHGNFMGYQQKFMNNSNRFNLRSGVNLYKISDLDPDYRNAFGNDDLMSYSLYSDTDEKVGSVKDILVDNQGNFRYLVVDTGFWVFGKNVLLPFGRARIDSSRQRIYSSGLTKEQVESLPEYKSDMTVDSDYEERVRKVYRIQSPGQYTTMGDTMSDRGSYTYDRDNYNYDREPTLYTHQERDATDNLQSMKLYEERLIANKERFRSGTVTVGKKVITETANVSVPVEKERVIIERHAASEARPVAPGEATFAEGEVARLEVYEEAADIEKQAYVREEISVRKEVEQETVSARETIRREELDIDTDGDVTVNRDRDLDRDINNRTDLNR